MIKLEKLWAVMQERGITQYQLIRDYGISHGQLDRIRRNQNVTLNTIDILCNILDCQPGDILEHVKDDNDRFRPDSYAL